MNLAEVEAIARKLAFRSGLGKVSGLVALKGGGNNQVFAVEAEGRALLKLYFVHPRDTRDRLQNEFSFSQYAWAQGVHQIPRPLVYESENRAGLYEFVEGRSLFPEEVTKDRVSEALSFFEAINVNKIAGKELPDASEACFSITEHLQCVDRRLQRLREINSVSDTSQQAIQFINHDIRPGWYQIAEEIRRQTELDSDLLLTACERCVSPSDFGFHNALLERNGYLRFLDFEYAGWDDPAKLVCDFFCQPALPVPENLLNWFVQKVANQFPDPERLVRRIALLLPVYRIKWCCIMLNEFLPVGSARRRFADNKISQTERESRQLEKAKHAFARLKKVTVLIS